VTARVGASPRSGRDGIDRSIRLLVYSDDLEDGGTAKAAGTLIGALSPRFEVTVLGVDRRMVEWIASHRPGTAALTVPPVKNKWDVRPILAHIRAVRRLAPDVLHASLRHPWAGQYGILAGLLATHVKVVAVENSPIAPRNARQRWLRRMLVRRYDAYVAVGDRVARLTESRLGLPHNSVRTIHNGGAIPEVTEPAARISAGPVVGCVARLAREKALDVLLDALALLPDVNALLIGDGPERSALEEQAVALEVADRVVFAGWQPEPARFFPSMDVFVLPSRFESFGLAVLEAMLAGLPVVACDVGSVGELVVDGTTGLLVPPDDASGLADALRRLLDSPELRARMGAAGRRRALELFAPEIMARQYETLYDELLA